MKHTSRTDEKGMVAMIVTLIMMLVITLIVLGFSESTRRNQREALDTQLGLQAYYAAESGVNDVASLMKANQTLPTDHTNDCDGFIVGGVSYPKPLTTETGEPIQNTCLMVDPEPPSLVADSITNTTGSVVWHVQDANTAPGTVFTKFQFSWQPAAVTTPAPACNVGYRSYPKSGDTDWKCNYALLRVDIIPTDKARNDRNSAADLAKDTTTLYLQPGTGNNPVTIVGFGGNSTVYQGSCVAAAPCTATVNLDPGARFNDFYMRVTSMYRDAKSVTLRASDNVASTADFASGQVMVDSTGRAQDQLKRISVRIPLTASVTTDPIYGLQGTGSICKDLTINTGVYLTGSCTNWPIN